MVVKTQNTKIILPHEKTLSKVINVKIMTFATFTKYLKSIQMIKLLAE